MSEIPAYLTQTFQTQFLQLIQKMPAGEEFKISSAGVKFIKNGVEQELQLTSLRYSIEIEGYLDEFRVIRNDEVKLPKITGSPEQQCDTIMDKLELTINKKTFKYYYLLGRLLKEHPGTIGDKIRQRCKLGRNQSTKVINLAKKTEELFNTVGLSYLSLRKLRPRILREMSVKNFEDLMTGVRAIVAERLETSALLDEILRDLPVPISQELNLDEEVMSPECEFDLNLLINNPGTPQ